MPSSMSSVSREIATLRRTLKAMDRSLRRLGPKLLMAMNRANGSRPERAGRKMKMSPKRRAQLKLQGQYIGYMRQLKATQRAKVRKVRNARGVEMAIRKAKELAS